MIRPMDEAPAGDGWVLGYVPDINGCEHSPWLIVTRCDGGWCDSDGYGVDPTGWHPLPDPQPTGTGWRKAEGEIVIEAGWIGDAKGNDRRQIWLTSVVLASGRYDEGREPGMWDTPAQAVAAGEREGIKLGLPVRCGNMIHHQAKVVPISEGRRQ